MHDAIAAGIEAARLTPDEHNNNVEYFAAKIHSDSTMQSHTLILSPTTMAYRPTDARVVEYDSPSTSRNGSPPCSPFCINLYAVTDVCISLAHFDVN